MAGLGAVAAGQGAPAASHAEWKDGFAKQLRDDFRAHWKSEKEYSLAVCEAMPAEHLDFKPASEQRSFAEQMVHYSRANIGYFSNFKKSFTPPDQPESPTPESLRRFVLEAYEFVDNVLGSLTEADFLRRDVDMGRMPTHTAQDVFFRAYVHSAHHRGSAIVYLRLKGITPPRWRFPALGVA